MNDKNNNDKNKIKPDTKFDDWDVLLQTREANRRENDWIDGLATIINNIPKDTDTDELDDIEMDRTIIVISDVVYDYETKEDYYLYNVVRDGYVYDDYNLLPIDDVENDFEKIGRYEDMEEPIEVEGDKYD